ncbi:MAG: mandelate racemase [Planctomycetes bacterium]|nr:mandelate racemase [Planctomycetota bacterium]
MSSAPRLAVTQVAFARSPCRTRLPFRFGAVRLRQAETLTCRVTVRGADGATARGWSADLLVPRWFRKDTDATPQQDADELFASATASAQAFAALPTATAFGLWREVMAARVDPHPFDQPDQLVRGFGVALVERALLDATCRLVGLPFAQALRRDAFGFRPQDVHAELADFDWQRALPAPRPRVIVRHTIGMLDALRASELAPADRLDDGLPQTLEDDLDIYGVTWFKVKVGAGVDRDRARLLELARFFDERGELSGFSLDGNEQYGDLGEVAELLEAVAAEPLGARLLERLAWIEQPLSRAVTFDPERHRDVARVQRFAPLMIDEADATPRAFQRARELGYRGVSVKNCKGVFRALCNFGVCRRDGALFQSGEDLTNIGVLALQQDLVTQSVLGLPHVERNGHHYFRGLDHLPEAVQRRARDRHGDLYRGFGDGSVTLRISKGEVAIGSALRSVGYGTDLDDFAVDMVAANQRAVRYL